MTTNVVTFDYSGNTDGAALTAGPGNSGFDSLSGTGSGNSAVIDAASAAHGSFGGRFTTAAGAANGIFGTKAFPLSTALAFGASDVVKLPASLPSADLNFFRIRNASGDVVSMVLRTDGSIYSVDVGGTYTLIASSSQFTLGQKYRCKLYGTVGTSTSNGEYYAKVLLQSSGAPAGSTVHKTNANLGTANVVFGRTGVCSTSPGTSIGVDDFQLSDTAAEPADYVPAANLPPVVSAHVDQSSVTTGTTVALSGTATDSDGTVSSVQWDCISHPGLTAPAISTDTSLAAAATLTPAGTYTLRLTATDNSGASSSDSVTVTVTDVPPSGAHPYTGTTINLSLPVPKDPGTRDQWGTTVNDALVLLRDAVNDLIRYYNSVT